MKKLMFVAVLLVAMLATGAMAQSSIVQMGKAAEWTGSTKSPGSILDSFAVYNGAATLRKCAVSTKFKGAADDTIRVVAVQSAAPRRIRIMTDTSTTTFGPGKFRMDSCAYGLPSGATPNGLAVGDINGDGVLDIVTATSVAPFRVFWLSWDGVSSFVVRDSFSVNAAVWDVTIGDANNDGNANEIFFNIAQTAPSSAVMRAVWTAPGVLDTTRILLSGIQATTGVAIGDVRSDLTGNEVYVVGGTTMWMVHFNGASWDTSTIVTGFTSANDVAVGDVDPTLPGNEIAIVHASTSYQMSVTNWTGTQWAARLWALSATWGTSANDIAIGDVMSDNPGNEVLLAPGGNFAPRAFWISPVGGAWTKTLTMAATGNYGVAIGNVNKFRTLNNEFVLTGMGGRIVENQQRVNATDLGTQSYRMTNGAFAQQGQPDTIAVNVFNAGGTAVSSFYMDFKFKTSALKDSVLVAGPLNSLDSTTVKIPIGAYDFTGFDTMYVYPSAAGDANPANDTTKLHIEPVPAGDSAVVWSGFNTSAFAPSNATYSPVNPQNNDWKATILAGSYNWRRITTSTSPTIAAALEGAGMAQFDSYNSVAGSSARLRTNLITIGASPRKVRTSFYFYRDADATYNDSLIVQYSLNGVDWTSAKGLVVDTTGFTGWRKYDVEIGDFAAGQQLYLGFYGRSDYGNRKVTIDSVRAYTTVPTPPVITLTDPASAATGVVLNKGIKIGFSKPINPSTFAFTCPGLSNPVASWPQADTVVITHDDFTMGTSFTVTVTAAQDMIGLDLAAGSIPNPFTFTANLAPVISMKTQPSSTNSAGPYAVQAVIVDVAKKKGAKSVATDSLYYRINSGSWAVVGATTAAGDTFDFAIPGMGSGLVEYYLQAWDNAGASTMLPSSSYYSFTVDTIAPSITGIIPVNGATKVDLHNPIIISFSEPMNPASVATSITPFVNGLNPVWNATNDTLTFAHTVEDFALNTVYTASVTGGADVLGNTLTGMPDSIMFTTIADTTKPVVLSTTPVNGASGVALNAPVMIAFSKAMDTLSVMSGGSFLPNPANVQSVWSATLDTLTLTHDPMAYNTAYTVKWTAGTDTFGNSLAVLPDSLMFTTVANQGPQYEWISGPADTYDGTGPFAVRVRVYDLVKKHTMSAKTGVTSATLYYQASNTTTWTPVAGALTAPDTFDFSIPGPFANGLVVSYLVQAADDANDTTQSITRQFQVLKPLPPTGLVATSGADMRVPMTWSAPAESLYYYNSASTVYVFNMPATSIVSTRYTPKHYPCKIAQIRSSWNTAVGNSTMHFRIYGDNGNGFPDEGNVLFDSVYTPTSGTWGDFLNLTAKNLVITSGDFHVSWETVTYQKPRPRGTQDGGHQFRSTYKWSDGIWYADLGGDWMNRVFVQYSNAFKGGVALKSAHITKAAALAMQHNPGKPKVDPETKMAPAGNLPRFDMAKNVSGYEVLRGPNGGPYTSIGTATTTSYTDLTTQNGNTYYYVVRTTFSTPDTFSANSNQATATPAAKPILLVDDDASWGGNIDADSVYTAALDSAGQAGNYTIYESQFMGDGPDTAWLRNRAHVIWYTGEAYGAWDGNDSTLTPANEASLAWYLNQGGKLFLSAQDYLYDRCLSAGYPDYTFTAGEFPYDYLGVDSVHQDFNSPSTSPFNVAGVGYALTDGMAFTVGNTPLTHVYADNLTKQAGALYDFDVTAKVGEHPAVQYSSGTFRTVFFAFPFENITDAAAPNTRGALMSRILSWLTTGVEGKPAVQTCQPVVYDLAACYPNPARERTTIKFALPKAGTVRIEVYNIAGQKVKTLVNTGMDAGYHGVTWNGRNDAGQAVAAGMYMYRMTAGNFAATRKLVLVK